MHNILRKQNYSDINTFVFDLDDTLINTYSVALEKTYFCLDTVGIPISRSHFERQFRETYLSGEFQIMIDRLIPRNKTDSFLEAYDSCRDMFCYSSLVELESFLEIFRKENKSIGILSNSKNEKVLRKLKDTGLEVFKKRFQFILGEEDLIAKKPSQASMDVLAKYKLKKPIAYVGDSYGDLQCTQNSGIYFIPVSTGPTIWNIDRSKVCTSIEEIVEHIR